MGRSQSKQSKDEKIRLALVGPTGSGKSAFVNAIRGFADDHEQAAKVNVNTPELSEYTHPTNPLVILCDLPGYGAKNYPNHKTYWNKFELETFDEILIFTKDEMTEFDLTLAQKIKSCKKSPFIIRTHIDNYCKIKAEEKGTLKFIEEEHLEEIKEHIAEHLSCNKKEIFLINNYEPRKWDFLRLIETIISVVPIPPETTSDVEMEYLAQASEHIRNNGVSGIQNVLMEGLERWKDAKIRFGITGNSGTGKSSFINAIRGLKDDDAGAAGVSIIEATTEPTEYKHPDNPSIIFVDLPGVGTPSYPDLPQYCEKFGLEDYDTFLIFTTTRFTQNDLDMAKKVKSIGKSFFLIRTKIDVDCNAESRKGTFNEEEMLGHIRENCFEGVKDLISSEKEIFLISNHDIEKWDFDRLVNAISDALPILQRESLTLSLSNITRGCLKRKAKFLKAQAVAVATASAATNMIPIPGVGAAVNISLTYGTIMHYYRTFGLNDVKSENLNILNKKLREIIRRYQFKSVSDLARVLATKKIMLLMSGVDQISKYIPAIGTVIAGSISFAMTLGYLTQCVNDLEKAALAVWDNAAKAPSESSQTSTKTFVSYLNEYFDEANCTIEENGIEAAQNLMKKRLEEWKEIEISMAVAGDAGAGKSSFINTIRGLDNDDPVAAETGVIETTMIPTEYFYPANPMIKLWDIPETYFKQVDIRKYDVVIFVGATRFTSNDLALVEELKSTGKPFFFVRAKTSIDTPFFFVRAKIDVDVMNESKKKEFNEEEMLKKIRTHCSTKLKGMIAHEDNIFLISNHQQHKYDFPRLNEEILDKLSQHKQESFCLSMHSLSEGILESKVNTLKARICMVALKSIDAKALTTKSYSDSIDFQIIKEQVEFYRSQLGLPEKDSKEFQGMSEELQVQMQRFYLTDGMDVNSWLKTFDSDGAHCNSAPKCLDEAEAIQASFMFVYDSLYQVLDEMARIQWLWKFYTRPREEES